MNEAPIRGWNIREVIVRTFSTHAQWCLAFRREEEHEDFHQFYEELALASMEIAAYVHRLDSTDSRLDVLGMFPSDAQRCIDHVVRDLLPVIASEREELDHAEAARIVDAITAATLDAEKCPCELFMTSDAHADGEAREDQ